MVARRLAVVWLGLVAAGCEQATPPPPASQPPVGVEQITGSERIGWQQRAADAADLATLRYNIYVDNAVSEIQGVSCETVATDGTFSCSGRLPPMQPGRHTLQLTAFFAGTRIESPRSPSLAVSVGQPASAPAPAGPMPIVTAEGARLVAAPVAAGLEDPTDLAAAPDGRVFVAERGGRILVFREGRLTTAIVLDDVVADGRRGLLAVALDPAFDRTGYLFAVYTADTGYRLVRLRAAGDTLGDGATLLDGIEAGAAAAAAMRFGPDGKLYLALDDAGDPSRSGDLGSYNGKVLRLNADGTTPREHARGTPIYAMNVNRPRGLDWDRGTLWIAETMRLQGVVETAGASGRASALVNYNLPPGAAPGGLTFYRGSLMPALTGDLLMADEEGLAVLRLKFDPDNRRAIIASEYLLRGTVGPVRAIAEDPRGIVYFCTPGALFTIVPNPEPRTPNLERNPEPGTEP